MRGHCPCAMRSMKRAIDTTCCFLLCLLSSLPNPLNICKVSRHSSRCVAIESSTVNLKIAAEPVIWRPADASKARTAPTWVGSA